MFTHNRQAVDLNGTWKFCPDPMQRCRRQKWWKNPSTTNGMFPSWDREGLWNIQVPGTWKKQFMELAWYDGHAVYLKDFELAEIPKDSEAFLVFDGIVYAADIYLNGQRLGQHDWGYSCFTMRVTELLQKSNTLFVLVDNLLSKDRVPGEIFDWNNDGGIINGVQLIFTPATYIENFKTSTLVDDTFASLQFEVALSSRDQSASELVTVSIAELGISETAIAKAGENTRVDVKLTRSAIDLWSPEAPKLYRTTITTRWETITDEIGYREIRVDGPNIILNGKPIRLYGICVHSEFPDTGRTATIQGIEKVVATAKDLGLNFLRCAHYPYSDIWARAMDRAGLMWWEEVPAYWLFNMREEAMTRLACGMLEETIRRDWNRASLIIWSISNECCYKNPEDPSENNYSYWFKAGELVRNLDPSRPISGADAGNMVTVKANWSPAQVDQFAGVGEGTDLFRPMHTDELYDVFDILAANLYVGAAGEEATLYRTWIDLFQRYNKPLMLSEFGSISLRGADVPDDRLASEERHSVMIGKSYEFFESAPEIVGYCPWVLIDGRAPIHWRWFNQGTGLYRHGFLDNLFQPKKAYWTLRESIESLKAKMESV